MARGLFAAATGLMWALAGCGGPPPGTEACAVYQTTIDRVADAEHEHALAAALGEAQASVAALEDPVARASAQGGFEKAAVPAWRDLTAACDARRKAAMALGREVMTITGRVGPSESVQCPNVSEFTAADGRLDLAFSKRLQEVDQDLARAKQEVLGGCPP